MSVVSAVLLWALAGPAAAAAPDGPWPAMDGAFSGPAFSRFAPTRGGDESDLTLRKSGCPTIALEAFRSYSVTVRFEPRRTVRMDLLVGRLPPGLNAQALIEAAAKHVDRSMAEDGCHMPKSGLSLVQVDRYWIAFPTSCSDIYPYRKALPVALRALRAHFGARFPATFIYGPCGAMVPMVLDVAAYLSDPDGSVKAWATAHPVPVREPLFAPQ